MHAWDIGNEKVHFHPLNHGITIDKKQQKIVRARREDSANI